MKPFEINLLVIYGNTMLFDYPKGATPLSEDEKGGLIPSHITTQEQLNAFEQSNITLCYPWAFKQKDILNVAFIKRLHKKMFGRTWKWAGEYRKTLKNIGCEAYRIGPELQLLCGDVDYQINHHTYSSDEIAIRFHHRLVFVHPFSNGNGRHARLMADLLITKLGGKIFTWGSLSYSQDSLAHTNSLRKAYIQSLRAADVYDLEPLIQFSRS